MFKATKDLFAFSSPVKFAADPVTSLEFIRSILETCFRDIQTRLQIIDGNFTEEAELPDGDFLPSSKIAQSQIDMLGGMISGQRDVINTISDLKGRISAHLSDLDDIRLEASGGILSNSYFVQFAKRFRSVTEFNTMIKEVQQCVREVKAALREGIAGLREEGKIGAKVHPSVRGVLKELQSMKQAMNFSLIEGALKETRDLVRVALEDADEEKQEILTRARAAEERLELERTLETADDDFDIDFDDSPAIGSLGRFDPDDINIEFVPSGGQMIAIAVDSRGRKIESEVGDTPREALLALADEMEQKHGIQINTRVLR